LGCFHCNVGITSAIFKEKEDVPAMSIAALQKKYHCVIEIRDKTERSNAPAAEYHRRHADISLILLLLSLSLQINTLDRIGSSWCD